MHIGAYLSVADADRVRLVFEKLNRLGFADYAVTSGLALEAALDCGRPGRSTLNDIDLVAADFDALPVTLGSSFLVNHAHPKRPKGKLILQLVCPDTAVRVDVFSAYGTILDRTRATELQGLSVRVVAREDMASRIASEMMGFVRGGATSAKCAADYERLARVVDPELVEVSWQEQRRDIDPMDFNEACAVIDRALRVSRARLIDPVYSKTPSKCPHCEGNTPFRLVAPTRIVELLGYF
jgi:hypothetical protein